MSVASSLLARMYFDELDVEAELLRSCKNFAKEERLWWGSHFKG